MLKAIIFDMDDTLYTSEALKRAYREAACLLLAERKGLGMSDAVALYLSAKKSIEAERGYEPTNWMILHTMGFQWEEWVKQSLEHVRPEKCLKPDQNLEKVLRRLKAHVKLGILTNNNKLQAERILDALKIRGLFDSVLTVSDTGLVKPNPLLCIKIAESLGCAPEECLMVGDNPGIDLAPAQKIGMRVLHIRHVMEVYRLDVQALTEAPAPDE